MCDISSVLSSDEKQYIYSPVLNFVQVNVEAGIEDEIVIKHTADFFDISSVCAAKKSLYASVSPSVLLEAYRPKSFS
jgi:hypothetical protein